MKQRLMRPTAALFPLVGLIAALLSQGTRDFVLIVFILYYLIQLVSLCATDSFRNAAACEPGMRKVDRRFGGALPFMLIAVAAALLLARSFQSPSMDINTMYAVDHARYIQEQLFRAALTAAFISIEHLFEERMFALGRRVDGVILSCICNGILLAGALIDAEASAAGNIITVAAGIGMAISLVTAYAIEPPHGFSLKPRNVPFFPRACIQTLLYPAIACAAVLLQSNGNGAQLDAAIPAVLFGLIPWRLSRTTARRTYDESRPLNLLLIAFAAVSAIAAIWLPAVRPFALTATVALLCGAAVFCAPSTRLYAGIGLVIAAVLPLSYPYDLNAIPALVAILINIKHAFLRKG